MHWLELSEIPKPPVELFHAVDVNLKRFTNRIYSVDTGRGADGTWKIIELNSKPGLLPIREHHSLKTYHEKVAEVLLDVGRSAH